MVLFKPPSTPVYYHLSHLRDHDETEAQRSAVSLKVTQLGLCKAAIPLRSASLQGEVPPTPKGFPAQRDCYGRFGLSGEGGSIEGMCLRVQLEPTGFLCPADDTFKLSLTERPVVHM